VRSPREKISVTFDPPAPGPASDEPAADQS